MKKIVMGVFLLLVLSSVATAYVFSTENYAAGLNNGGYYLYQKGEYDLAAQLFLAAIEHDPVYEIARYNLATLYFETGRFSDAAAQLALLREQDPANPHYHYDWAVNRIEDIRQNKVGLEYFLPALDAYRTAEALEPGFARAAENIAVLEGMLS